MRLVKGEIQVLSNLEELTCRAADEFVCQAAEAVEVKGFFTVALSGAAYLPYKWKTFVASGPSRCQYAGT